MGFRLLPGKSPYVTGAQKVHMSTLFLRLLYALHLAIPSIFLLDCLFARYKGVFHFRTRIVLILCSLWLVAGLILLLISWNRQRLLQKLAKPLLSFYSALLVLVIAELALRAILAPHLVSRRTFVHPPDTRHTFTADEKCTPGITGEKSFSVNELGLRGPALAERSDLYEIVTVGGSTTLSADLDDSEEWPNLLMRYTNAIQNQRSVWVANAGVAGHTAVHHLKLIQTLPSIRKADMLIFLVGVNDLATALALEGQSTQKDLQHSADRFVQGRLFYGHSYEPYPFHERLVVFQLPASALRGYLQGAGGPICQEPARQERVGANRAPLPSLQVAIGEFRHRILNISRECHSLGTRCLFLTQPTMWRENLSPEEEALLWFGFIGVGSNRKGYASAADLAKAMDLYNQALLQTCRQNGIECYDLASAVPKNTSAFFDDCHFNENGSRIVARSLAEYLVSRPPSSTNALSTATNG
jgi:lysophospholipase L1-like esterase